MISATALYFFVSVSLSLCLPDIEVGLSALLWVVPLVLPNRSYPALCFSIDLMAFCLVSWQLIFRFCSHFLCSVKRVAEVLCTSFERYRWSSYFWEVNNGRANLLCLETLIMHLCGQQPSWERAGVAWDWAAMSSSWAEAQRFEFASHLCHKCRSFGRKISYQPSTFLSQTYHSTHTLPFYKLIQLGFSRGPPYSLAPLFLRHRLLLFVWSLHNAVPKIRRLSFCLSFQLKPQDDEIKNRH